MALETDKRLYCCMTSCSMQDRLLEHTSNLEPKRPRLYPASVQAMAFETERYCSRKVVHCHDNALCGRKIFTLLGVHRSLVKSLTEEGGWIACRTQPSTSCHDADECMSIYWTCPSGLRITLSFGSVRWRLIQHGWWHRVHGTRLERHGPGGVCFSCHHVGHSKSKSREGVQVGGESQRLHGVGTVEVIHVEIHITRYVGKRGRLYEPRQRRLEALEQAAPAATVTQSRVSFRLGSRALQAGKSSLLVSLDFDFPPPEASGVQQQLA